MHVFYAKIGKNYVANWLYHCTARPDVFSCIVSPQTEVTSPTDSEDRTPGRLQAVWPPPKPKDEEEKVGLKYTEAGKNRKLDTVL